MAAGESFQEYAHDAGRRTGEFSTIRLLMPPDVVPGIAEEIVEDAFAAMRLQWRRLRDPDRGVAFLRRFVVAATRSVDSPPADASGGPAALRGRTLAALWQLPHRQREALVLRYYADLPESQAAPAMGVTRAAFRWHVTQGMAALRLRLDAHGVAGLSTAKCTAVHRRRTAVHYGRLHAQQLAALCTSRAQGYPQAMAVIRLLPGGRGPGCRGPIA
jgi:predicted DNA-binding protein (UPF0251 family)